jgi:probable rRNA maturation factor
MINIIFTNQTRANIRGEDFFTTINDALKKQGITDKVEVELCIVGKTTMRRLNREYRGKDYAADVLSFPIWPNLATIKKQITTVPVSLGSIVVCPDAANEAMNFLIEHSIQHLLGFHHQGD